MEGDQFGDVVPQVATITIPLRHARRYADKESGLNTYGYVGTSPLHYRDPFGLLIQPGAGGGAIGIPVRIPAQPTPVVPIKPTRPIPVLPPPFILNKEDDFEQSPPTAMASEGKWSCTASCNVQVINPILDRIAPNRVTGSARGKTQPDACASAKREATQSAPRWTYARHCKCTCSKK